MKKIKRNNISQKNNDSNELDLAESHVRDQIQAKNITSDDGKFFKIISWNVNGLRAIISKANGEIFDNIIDKHNPDIICLQETKLQNSDGFQSFLPNYHAHWLHSTKKKGYAGTAVFIKKNIPTKAIVPNFSLVSEDNNDSKSKPTKRQKTLNQSWNLNPEKHKSDEIEINAIHDSDLSVENVFYDLNDSRFIGEGRTITVEFNKFYLVACYVPNSGQNLEKLDYRVDEWDPYIREYLTSLQKIKPVIFAGDLNVGHLDLDIHNPSAKHISKQAGLTPRERSSMTHLLETGFVDAFRHFHPDARGQFSYWSQRTFARPVNKGLRLDCFICSPSLFDPESSSEDKDVNEGAANPIEGSININTAISTPTLRVFDSYILHEDTVGYSDHCPVVLVLKLS